MLKQKHLNSTSSSCINAILNMSSRVKLDGEAPLITDPPPTSPTTLSEKEKKKKKKKILDTWHLTLDTWHLTCDTWWEGEHSLKIAAPYLLRFGFIDVLKVWRKRVTQLFNQLQRCQFPDDTSHWWYWDPISEKEIRLIVLFIKKEGDWK